MREPLKWGDIIVPYIAAWSSEVPERVGFDPHAGEAMQAIFCGGKRGEGKPVFGKMDFARQRQCVDRKLCQVCREKMDRMFAMQTVPHWIVERFIKYPMLSEPCVCAKCALYALANCPGIPRQMSDREFLAAEVYRYQKVPSIVSAMESSNYPDLDRVLKAFGGPAIGYVKLQLTHYDKLTMNVFRERIAHA